MNDIKFRAWNKNDKIMVYSKEDGYDDEKWGGTVEIVNNSFKDNENYEWLQYTGLKDKNDKEIYEGDIVKIISFDNKVVTIDEIKFTKGSWKVNDYYLHEINYKIEVVGDIYENPQLLEVLESSEF